MVCRRPASGTREILNGFCLATGYERKYAIRVLRGRQRQPVARLRRSRRRRYGLAFRHTLKVLWEASRYVCSDRLQPFLTTLVVKTATHAARARQRGHGGAQSSGLASGSSGARDAPLLGYSCAVDRLTPFKE